MILSPILSGRDLGLEMAGPPPIPAATSPPARRRPLACSRCRRRKVRCDGTSPACSNCARAGVECFEGVSGPTISRSRLYYLENRVRELEAASGVIALSDTRPNVSHNGDTSNIDPRLSGFVEAPRVDPLPNHRHQYNQSSQFGYPGDGLGSGPRQQTSRSSREEIPRPGSTVRALNSGQSPRAESNSIDDGASPAISTSSRITRDQPLAHEVGLLSLSNASGPKYLGPSSGVPFARLIYESLPQSQGLSLSYLRENEQDQWQGGTAQGLGLSAYDIQQLDLPSMTDCQQYAEIYFSISTFYPFISQDDLYTLLGQVMHLGTRSTWNSNIPVKLALAQIYLVLSLGARLLEIKLNSKFPSHDLFAKGMGYATQIKLHDSIEGVQVLLLLAQHSFYSPEGLNAWFLLHTIIASCLDLGLQRRDNCKKETETPYHRKTCHLRSAIFWSAYSIDRTLTTILGRPLTLRDEAIDREFPGLDNNDEVESAATQWDQTTSQDQAAEQQPPGLAPIPYTACVYSLRFDRIVAEIKLMLYRVSRSPSRFPWPTNLTAWQCEAQNACVSLLQEARNQQQSSLSNGFGTLSGVTLQRLELKYHHCIMLLYRPSPQIPRPNTEAIQACFSSAMDIISIYADLHRFLNMECSWLSAHSILVAAITVLYCLCSHPAVRGITPVETCLKRTELAHELLSFLGRSWSVADEAGLKLGRLIAATREVYSTNATVGDGLADRQGYEDGGNMVPLQQSSSGSDNPEMPALDGRAFLTDELGVLRDLFDLGWLDESEFENQPSFFGS